MYAVALDPANMANYADDFLLCFYKFSTSTPDPELKRMTWRMGQERARAWRRSHRRVPAVERSVGRYIRYFACANFAAEGLRVPDPHMRRSIQRAARRLRPEDFFRFNPLNETFPDNIPKPCSNCGTSNPRGRDICYVCKNGLERTSRYELFSDAVFTVYVGERFGEPLGVRLPDLLRWLPDLRPYGGYKGGTNPEFVSTAYAVTHAVYSLNDYCSYRLKPEWLPHEFEFLKSNLMANIAADNAELMGEFLDTLKSFGLTFDDPLIQAGTEFVMSQQNADGSWGPTSGGVFDRYHPTWTAICGLMDFSWRGERVLSPHALQRAQGASLRDHGRHVYS